MQAFDVGSDDIQWLASQSAQDLRRVVQNGFDLELVDFPARAAVSVDLRVYSAGLSCVRGLTPAPVVHAVVLLHEGVDVRGPPGSSCAAVFVSGAPGSTVRVEYNDLSASLAVTYVGQEASSIPREAGPYDDGGEDVLGLNARGVAVYTNPQTRSWSRVAGRVSAESLLRHGNIQVNRAFVTSDPIPADDPSMGFESPTSSASVKSISVLREEQGEPQLFALKKLPKVSRSGAMSAAEVTEFNMDRSAYVFWLVSSRYQGRWGGLIGELQIAFIGFVLLRDVQSLAHWSIIVREVCNASDGLVGDAPEFCAEFCEALRAQLELVEPEVFGAGLETCFENSVLAFCSAARETGVAVQDLMDCVRVRFGWRPTSEYCAEVE